VCLGAFSLKFEHHGPQDRGRPGVSVGGFHSARQVPSYQGQAIEQWFHGNDLYQKPR
jgi:hypothetical protein